MSEESEDSGDVVDNGSEKITKLSMKLLSVQTIEEDLDVPWRKYQTNIAITYFLFNDVLTQWKVFTIYCRRWKTLLEIYSCYPIDIYFTSFGCF